MLKKNINAMGMLASLLIMSLAWAACSSSPHKPVGSEIKPVLVTQAVAHDSDDPAIWIHPLDASKSLVLGTDKDENGGLVCFDLSGKILKTIPLKRPNNVDIETGLTLGGQTVDLAVVTERLTNRLRVFSLPDLEPVDGGGIEVFVGESDRSPMGIALYKRPRDGQIFAIVSRKTGPREGYLEQIRLFDNGQGRVVGERARLFGSWSGQGEIEAVAVDDALGYVYYADEGLGVHKYPADPDAPDPDRRLAILATEPYQGDREGISIYSLDESTGYILVSDQGANSFHVYPREGSPDQPHRHALITVLPLSTRDSDGSEVVSRTLDPRFPGGLFVAMSTDRTFHYYSWADLAGKKLKTTNQK